MIDFARDKNDNAKAVEQTVSFHSRIRRHSRAMFRQSIVRFYFGLPLEPGAELFYEMSAKQ